MLNIKRSYNFKGTYSFRLSRLMPAASNEVGIKDTEAGVYKSEAFMPAEVNKSGNFNFY